MATETVTHDYMNIIGNRREDYGHFTVTTGQTSGIFKTRLNWIDEIKIQDPGKTGNRTISTFVNTKTAVVTELIPGWVHYAEATDGTTLYFKATGR